MKTIKLSSQDKAWITTKINGLKRRKMREWKKNGKSPKYKKLAAAFEIK